MTPKRLLVFFILFFLGVSGTAQNIDSTIARYAAEYGQERTYIQYDKSAYAPGETVWYKAYLMVGVALADDSKTLYTDWTDNKGNLLLHNAGPVVDATSNGQFDIPAGYTGQFIHVKAYTKWMLNFDSTFLYEKDIRILTKNMNVPAAKISVVPTLQFFPEGGDAIAGIAGKIAFKATDQWGKPVKIKGVVQSSKGEKIDSLRIIHDGMGYFFLLPQPGETYTAKWKDEKGADHTTALPAIKSTGVSLQVTLSGNKRIFIVTAEPNLAKRLGPLQILGTINQYQAFKVTKDISSGSAKGVIPVGDLPSGILTITVFDGQWKPLAERITYINNDEYRFNAEMTVEHWGLNKRARNEIMITVPDSLYASFAVSVTDAGIEADSSDNIVSHLLLTGDIKGLVFNPAYYFSANNDTIAQRLDLVMLTHGWRRFIWEDVVKGKLPKIVYPKDTAYLYLSGKVYGATPSQLRDAAHIILIIGKKKSEGENKMVMLPVMPNGTFNDPSLFLFDTVHIFYRLSKGLNDASVTFMENRLPAIRYRIPAIGIFYNKLGDTTGYSRHFQLSDETLSLLKELEGKTLENVIVRAKTKSPLEILDQKYSSGLFSGGDGYQFDLVNDQLSFASRNVFEYLQSKVAGLQVNTSTNPPTMTWRGGSPQLFLDEVPMDADFVTSISVSQIAYIKVFRPPFFGGSGNSSNGAISIYTRRGDDVKADPGKGLSNNMVSGYSPIRQFYSPNYSSFNAANEKRDLRTTLYWNPQVATTPLKNKVKLSFYNNDVSKSFRVVIEGITKDGQLVHLEQIMD
ncbi:MAG: hypothetical protein LH619_09955 [Chitinophagaceae bacterium]|nr:hypothetical protein [Chitinophagaceae bacterium]